MRKNKKKSKKRKSSFLCHLWNGIIIVLPRSILVLSNGQSYSGGYSRTCSQHSRTFNQSYFPFSYSKRNNRTSYCQYRTSYFNKHIVLFNRTSYLNYRTPNYRTLNCFRTLHLHSRTLCKSYYWYRTTSDSSQPWSEVKTFMQSKRNKASSMPDVVLCKHDSYNLTETFSHTQSCQHEEKYDHRGTWFQPNRLRAAGSKKKVGNEDFWIKRRLFTKRGWKKSKK